MGTRVPGKGCFLGLGVCGQPRKFSLSGSSQLIVKHFMAEHAAEKFETERQGLKALLRARGLRRG
jgi:hypothetical protein